MYQEGEKMLLVPGKIWPIGELVYIHENNSLLEPVFIVLFELLKETGKISSLRAKRSNPGADDETA
jgi:hypothetical protein